MIVKKLRHKHKWSQEQLAELCGLNVRTIQRVENGSKASIETLKCLASVFEVNISTLTEEITVIDKESESWRELPLWFRFNMFGINTRRSMLTTEFSFLFVGFIYGFLYRFGFLDIYVTAIPSFVLETIFPTFIFCAYLVGWIVRYGDRKEIW